MEPVAYAAPSEKWDQVQENLSGLVRQLPEGRLARLKYPCSVDSVVAAMWRDGVVILENVVSVEACERVIAQMKPYVDEVPYSGMGDAAVSVGESGAPPAPSDGAARSKRPGCVLSRSDASWELAAHPIVVETLEGVLGRQVTMHDLGRMQAQLMRAPYHAKPFKQHPFQLELSQMICIPPGTSAQQLHQDIGKHVFDFRGMLEPRRPCARLCSRAAPGTATVTLEPPVLPSLVRVLLPTDFFFFFGAASRRSGRCAT